MVGIITAARAQIIIATCDDVPLDADDFPELGGLPAVTVAARTVVPDIPTAAKPLTIVSVLPDITVASSVIVVPALVTKYTVLMPASAPCRFRPSPTSMSRRRADGNVEKTETADRSMRRMAATAVLIACVNRVFFSGESSTTPSISYVAVMKACMSTSVVTAIHTVLILFFVVSITCVTV